MLAMALSAGGVWMPKGGSSGAAFSPSQLSGLQLLLNLGQASTLRQDAAGTTAVAADNDPIGRALDQSPAARVYTSSGGQRSLYRTSAMGGLPGAQFDGSDDVLTATAAWTIAGAQTWTLDFQLTATPTGFAELVNLSDGTTACALYASNSGGYTTFSFRFGYTAAGLSVGYNLPYDTARHRFVIVYDGVNPNAPSSYRLWVDGVEVTVIASSTLGYLGSGSTLGNRPDASTPAPVRLRKLALHSAAYPANATQLDGWATT